MSYTRTHSHSFKKLYKFPITAADYSHVTVGHGKNKFNIERGHFSRRRPPQIAVWLTEKKKVKNSGEMVFKHAYINI